MHSHIIIIHGLVVLKPLLSQASRLYRPGKWLVLGAWGSVGDAWLEEAVGL